MAMRAAAIHTMRAHHTVDKQAVRDVHDAFQMRCEANTALFRARDLTASTPYGLTYAAALVSCAGPRTAVGGSAMRIFHPSVDQGTRDAALARLLQRSPPSPRTVVAEAPQCEPVTYFHSRTVPPLTLYELGAALDATCACGEEALLVALVLVDRYCAIARVRPTAHMMHRLYVTCLQVGIKTHCDQFLKNATFAEIAGVHLSELNCCEAALLQGIQWHALVTSEECIGFVRAMLDWRQSNSPSKRRASPPCASATCVAAARAALCDSPGPLAAVDRADAESPPTSPTVPYQAPVGAESNMYRASNFIPTSNHTHNKAPRRFTPPRTTRRAASFGVPPAAMTPNVPLINPAHCQSVSDPARTPECAGTGADDVAAIELAATAWSPSVSSAATNALPTPSGLGSGFDASLARLLQPTNGVGMFCDATVDPETPPNTPVWGPDVGMLSALLPAKGLPHLRAIFHQPVGTTTVAALRGIGAPAF